MTRAILLQPADLVLISPSSGEVFRLVPDRACAVGATPGVSAQAITLRVEQNAGFAVTADSSIAGTFTVSATAGAVTWVHLVWNEFTLKWDVTSTDLSAYATTAAMTAAITAAKAAMWPIGSIFISVVATEPDVLLGFGEWVQIGQGRVLVGIDSGDADFDTVEETGGAKTVAHTHSVTSNVAVGNHAPNATTANSGAAVEIGAGATTAAPAGHTHDTPEFTHAVTNNAVTSGSTSPSVVQPYLVVYMWKRVEPPS